MPRMSESSSTDMLIKMLLIADGKTGKSWYAGTAAESLNVLYIDGDVAVQTLKMLDKELQKRIFLMAMGDTMDSGEVEPRFHELVHELFTDPAYLWNDSKGREFNKRKDFTAESTDEVWKVSLGAMDSSWLVVIDSWTSLIESIMTYVANELGIDLAEAKITDMREVYRASGNTATNYLRIIRAAPCHFIVIAHPDELQKRKAPDGAKVGNVNEKEMIIEFTKAIPKSTSRAHSMTMSKYFTDVAWVEVTPSGKRRLDFRAQENKICGGHFSGRDSFENYSFQKLIDQIGGHNYTPEELEEKTTPGLAIYPNGSYLPKGAKPLESSPEEKISLVKKDTPVPKAESDGAKPKPSGGGLASLIAKSKSNNESK